MKLFIAEKPELGRAIAAGLNGTPKIFKDYIIKGDNIISWAYGHILELAMPELYNEKYKNWNLQDLPIKIEKFKYIPIQSSKNQLKILVDLIKNQDVSEIIHCGDADDEGQILIDEILEYAKNTKPVKRLLVNDNTEQGIKKALNNIKDNKEFYGLSQRGFARSQADFIVGINLTRAYTKKAQQNGYKGGILSLGRVQTPILSLIVNRDNEHENFKSIDYFTLQGIFDINGKILKANHKIEEKITDEKFANEIKQECISNQPVINSINIEKKSENPPLPYSLLKLQVDCSKIFAYKPDETLKITQQLRENHRCITYNRSDCEYLPTTLFEESPQILSSLKSNFISNSEILSFIDNTDLNIKSIAFNDNNITAHHAIIPTNQKFNINDLNKEELNVYILIVKRFLSQFFDKKEFNQTTIEISINNHKFTTSQTIITKSTFDKFIKEQNENIENENLNINLESINKNDEIKVNDIVIQKKKTNPKPYYNMASLLKDLTGVAKYAKDEKIKKLLLEKDKDKKGENGGIGTPATRSNHLNNLIEKGYIEVSEDKKQIVKSTQKGKDLIKIAPDCLTCVDMTALWFEMQKDIEQNILSKEQFLKNITEQISLEIDKVRNNQMSDFKDETQISCPACKDGFLIRRESKNKKGQFYWTCSNYKSDKTGCNAIFYDKDGKPILEKKEIQEPENKIMCPKCKKGYLIKHNSISKKTNKPYDWFGCSEWKNSNCQFHCFTDENGNPKFENI